MKWLIATTLAGSTALVPAAITTEQPVGNPDTFSITGETYEEFTLPVDPVLLANRLRAADLHEKNFLITERKAAAREKRENRVLAVLEKVKSHVGKTPYVFSGASPSGWDCSGLVMWTYSQLGIELPHSASAQLSSGKHVKDPQAGDIVVWGGGYHSGIYLGNGKVVNALNPTRDTNIVSVDELGGSVTYVRVYDY